MDKSRQAISVDMMRRDLDSSFWFRVSSFLPAVLLLVGLARGADWPQWRGPNRDAVSPEAITLWPPVKAWQANVGVGVSAPIAMGGRVYAVGHKEGQDTVWCFDGESGNVLWQESYPSRSDQTSDVRLPGPRSTPATDGRNVYVLSLEGFLRCLDAASGRVLWTRAPGELGANIGQYGICNPILLYQQLIICDLNSTCVAVDKTTGKVIWRAPGGGGWNGAAPMIVKTASRTCVIYGTGKCVDVASGKELWTVPYNECSVLTPIVSGDRVFLAPFHGRNYGGQECAVLQVKDGKPAEVWKNEEVQGLCSSGLLFQGNLYVPDRDDISIAGESGKRMNIKCIDFATGQVKWAHRPVPWPNLIVAGDKLLIQTLNGELALADASPEDYREHGRVRPLTGPCWVPPALSDGRLYCRNIKGDLVALKVSGQVGPNEQTLPLVEAAVVATLTPDRVDDPAFLDPGRASEAARQETGNWPRFRGQAGDGVSWSASVPVAWNGKSGQGVLWKSPVPIAGYSSPIVWGNRVFLTGANARMREVYCFDTDSGKLLWQKAVSLASPTTAPVKVWRDPSYAAPTPATDGQYICALFANGDIAGFDYEGRQLWARNLGIPENQYGHASSPIIYKDLVLIQWDQGQAEDRKSRLMALDIKTGKTAWEKKRPVGASWSTPILIDAADRQELITCGIPWVAAYAPEKGQELWGADALDGGQWAAPSPTFANGLVFAVTESAALVAIRADGKGDVSKTHIAWRQDEQELPNVCSPVSDGDLVFTLLSSGVLTCYNAANGSQLWQKDYSEEGRSFEASPSIAGGRVYLLDSKGTMYIIKCGRKFEEIGRAELGEPCPGASPAFVGGRIYIRGERNLYCVGAKGK